MPKPSGPRGALSVPARDRLARVLESPNLDRIVQQLQPEMLHELVRQFGMDVCAPLVGVATPEQVRSLADLDLWRPDEAGRDDRFDGARFVEWIELLADADVDVAARTLAAMDSDLAIAGLSEWVRVFDPAALGPAVASDDEPLEPPAPSHRLECQVGGYLVRAKRPDGWDALVAVLTALANNHAERFHLVMRGCRRLSNSAPEVDGLDDLLSAPDQQLHDVAIDREDRRSGAGYLSPADARAFLEGARRSQRPGWDESLSRRGAVTAYFRETEDAAKPLPETAQPSEDVGEALVAIAGLLASPEPDLQERPLALLEAPDAAGPRLGAIAPLLAHLHEFHPAAYEKRTRELAFLTNALIAGCSVQSRAFTPREASDAAVSTCNLGLERAGGSLPLDALVTRDLLTAFESGWALLFDDVSLFVADRLVGVLRDLEVVDRPLKKGLDGLRRIINQQRRAGTPWRARDALDVLAPLDTPAWAGLLGLFSECPVVPAILPAIVAGRAGTVSQTDFEFISMSTQIDMIREFVARLPDLFAS